MFKQKSDSPAAKAEPADAVQQARTRARHRLIGAVVLLAVGIIGFPLVFETQPRPIPIDIPIEIPRRDAMPPLAMPAAPSSPAAVALQEPRAVEAPSPSSAGAPRPAVVASRPATAVVAAPAAKPPRSAEAMITESSGDAGRDVTPGRPASATEPASRVVAPASVAAPPRSPEAPQRATGSDGDRARALLEGRSAATAAAPAAAESQRFVVQVGAFADAEAAREARKQVDKLGLKTYTQVAQTASGSRIRVRVGPFSTRAEADAAVARAKAAGLAAVVLTL